MTATLCSPEQATGEFTPDVIGRAARAGEHDPQALKRVWRHLVRFGGNAASR